MIDIFDDEETPLTRPVSLHHIAHIIGAEGFTDHAANEVKRYWYRRVMSQNRKRRVVQVKDAFVESVLPKLSAADRLVMGKYIALLVKQSFDTGIRMGLMTFAHKGSENP